MSAVTPGADRLATLTACLLLLLALPVAGLVALPLLPTSAAGFLDLAVPLLSVLLVALALPAATGRTPVARALILLLVAAPFLVFGSLVASGGVRGVVLPGLGLALALTATLALSAAGARLRRGVAAALLGLWAVDAVLAEARVKVLDAQLNPLRAPVFLVGPAAEQARTKPGSAPRGLRPGAFVRVEGPDVLAGARGAGPWFFVAEEGPVPRDAAIVRVAGVASAPEPERVPRPDGADTRGLYLVRGTRTLSHPFDLGGVEILLVAPEAWEADAQAVVRAQAVARFARLGGLVVGVGPTDPWPPELSRALGPAAVPVSPAAPASITPLGLGGVLHAGDQAEALARVGPWLDLPRLATAFDGLAAPPEPPAQWTSAEPPLEGRGPGGLLLLGFAVAVLLLGPGARRTGATLAALAIPAAAVVVGLFALAPDGHDLEVQAAVLELGGPGGRRVEALWLRAGERGYRGRVTFEGGGALRWVGGNPRHDRLRLDPGESGWVVRHLEARGPDPADAEDRRAGWLRAWLRGDVSAGRLRYGRAPLAGVHLEGVIAPVAATLHVAPE